jgi:hypothetical protein
MDTNNPNNLNAPSPETMPGKSNEIKLISHSNLFYWWPVWLLAFVMAGWTYLENHRLAIVPSDGYVEKSPTEENKYTASFQFKKRNELASKWDAAAKVSESNKVSGKEEVFRPRIASEPGLGSVFVIVLVLTLVITNVPLRGLWSFLVIIGIVTLSLFITVLNKWDDLLNAIGGLHVYINLAGYLFIGTAVFIVWALATFVFDRRSFVIFTPGQIKVCEHIGDAVQTFPTFGISLKKERDDIFRHWVLGLGSGDLILTTNNSDRREIRLPNVLGIGWRLKSVEDMIRTTATAER